MKIGGRTSKLESGGHSGKKETPHDLKAKGATAKRLRFSALVYFMFGVNRIWWAVGDPVALVDFIGNL